MKAALTYLLDILVGVILKRIYEFFKGIVVEKEAVKVDDKVADEAVAEIRKPLDPSKSVEEREKDAEAAFKKFHDKLKRN